MRELEDNTMAKKHGLAKVVLGVGATAVRKDSLKKRMIVLMMKSVSIMLSERRRL